MTALARNLIAEAPVSIRTRAKLRVVTTTAAEPPVEGSVVKNVALFLAAPFLGLAYIIALPVVGLAVLTVLAARLAGKYKAVRLTAGVVRNVGPVVVAPLAGLAYVVLFPVIGLTALAWMGGRAAFGR